MVNLVGITTILSTMTQETMQRHVCKNTLSAMMQLTKGWQMNITSIAKQWDIV